MGITRSLQLSADEPWAPPCLGAVVRPDSALALMAPLVWHRHTGLFCDASVIVCKRRNHCRVPRPSSVSFWRNGSRGCQLFPAAVFALLGTAACHPQVTAPISLHGRRLLGSRSTSSERWQGPHVGDGEETARAVEAEG